MNNASVSNPTGLQTTTDVGVVYGIGVSVSLLLLVTAVVLASFYCSRTSLQTSPSPATRGTRWAQQLPENTEVVVELGLDEETIESYPKMVFSEAKLEKKEAVPTSCSICLADYISSDMVRQLPECSHFFHLKCVDPWLRLNSSCPLCRKSPNPTPAASPLTEVVSLPSRRDR